MFNMCLHRGMQVCRAELGNASHFRCPYHAWTYRNDGRLAGLPFHQEAYGGEDGFAAGEPVAAARAARRHLQRADLRQPRPGRAAAARTTSATSRSTSTSTPARAPAGVELRGPQRWRVKANWKIGAENFAGDMLPHAAHPRQRRRHRAVPRAEGAASARRARCTSPAPAAAPPTSCRPGDFARAACATSATRDEMIDRPWRRRGRPASGRWSADDGFMVSAATLFPNLSFVHNWPQIDDDGTVVPRSSRSASGSRSARRETEVLSWFAVDRERAGGVQARLVQGLPDVLRQRRACSSRTTWRTGSRSPTWPRGSMARRLPLNSRMGLTVRRQAGQPAAGRRSPGPASAYLGYGEYNQRHWLGHVGRLPRRRERASDQPLPAAARTATRAHLAAHQFLVEEAALLDAGRLRALARRC